MIVGSQNVVNSFSNFQANKCQKIKGCVAETYKEIISRASGVALENDFVLSHIQLKEDDKDMDKEKRIKNFNKWTKKMLNMTPINGMCLILLGNGSSGICFIHINRPAIVPVP